MIAAVIEINFPDTKFTLLSTMTGSLCVTVRAAYYPTVCTCMMVVVLSFAQKDKTFHKNVVNELSFSLSNLQTKKHA